MRDLSGSRDLRARKEGIAMELPVKTKAKGRKIEKRTVLVFHDSDTLAIQKRPDKGLLAGLYELPNLERLAESTRSDRVQQVHRAFSDPYQKTSGCEAYFQSCRMANERV